MGNSINRVVRLAFVSTAFCLGLGTIAAPAVASDIFKGKTITYVVATSPGGGYDGYSRLTARYMEKYLPGSTFVVINRPGAGHLIGTNLIYSARPNGQTIGSFNMGVLYSQLVGSKAARFDLAKMSWVGKAAADKRIIMVAAQSPFKSFHDLQKAKNPVPFAVSGVGSAAYTELRLLANVYNLKIKLMSGYSGTEDDLAMMRGEVVGKMGAISGQGDFVRRGRGRFILQVGGTRETGHGNMTYGADIAKTPEQKAVMKLIASQGQIMRVTAGPPAIRADRLSALRDAYGKAYTDAGLLAAAKKLHYVIGPAVGEAVAKTIRETLKQPPTIVAMLNELQNSKPKTFTIDVKLVEIRRGGREIHFTYGGNKKTKSKISGSRTVIKIAGKSTVRGKLKVGMACAVTYRGPKTESTLVDCK
jgi:tripartite-type tricarboxylate transporter receptor subunit TctC